VAVLAVELSQRLELVDERAVLALEHHDAHLQTRDVLLLLPPTHARRLTAPPHQSSGDIPPTTDLTLIIDVKNVFLRFYFGHLFYVFLFSKRVLLKNVGKVQSGKQINKKHFQNNSNEIDL